MGLSCTQQHTIKAEPFSCPHFIEFAPLQTHAPPIAKCGAIAGRRTASAYSSIPHAKPIILGDHGQYRRLPLPHIATPIPRRTLPFTPSQRCKRRSRHASGKHQGSTHSPHQPFRPAVCLYPSARYRPFLGTCLPGVALSLCDAPRLPPRPPPPPPPPWRALRFEAFQGEFGGKVREDALERGPQSRSSPCARPAPPR